MPLLSSPSNLVVVWDVETTELIDRDRVPIEDMDISVACAVCFDADDAASVRDAVRVSFWSDKMYASRHLAELAELLAECKASVAFNGLNFDIRTMKKHFASDEEYGKAVLKLYDPFDDLMHVTGPCSLASLLRVNGLETKGGKGSDAPAMWKQKRFDDLESYCKRDVELLAQLITARPTIRIPGVMEARHPLRISELLFADFFEGTAPAPSNLTSSAPAPFFPARKRFRKEKRCRDGNVQDEAQHSQAEED